MLNLLILSTSVMTDVYIFERIKGNENTYKWLLYSFSINSANYVLTWLRKRGLLPQRPEQIIYVCCSIQHDERS